MEITRRRALLAGLATAGAVTVGTWPSHGDAPTSAFSPAAAARTAAARPVPRPVPARPAAWTRRWHEPVSSITDFERRVPSSRFPHHAVMLTVDDGPSPEWTPKYLALFARHGVTATFCMIGRRVPANRGLVRDVADHGHVIANHTWTHDEQLTYRPAARIRSEIERTSHAIGHATGRLPTQFRAPGGTWGSALFAELARQRMMPLGWDVDPADWSLPGTAAITRTMLTARPRDIILCHDGGGDRDETYRALRRVIPALLDRGLTFVSLPTAAPS